ncbi:GNAT family N-acetyltransferase [Exiguobacterium mexicanum]|uniref:GNAT family N-acetyltransferase n=1 Tax=Exiguobacterium mexicanum TaxID=340146 RepID=A0ABT7MRR0_9BACL|nr:GNAT family N-acetyltransferase [Exiguobacterium mexicanum]MDL5377904.1 GNAT family N-acetyltransferase [Exiguobacterium mexicanum]
MIHVYDATWRDKVATFLLRQRSFAALNGQTPETFRDENLTDFEAEETVSLVFTDGDVIAVADLLKKHPVDGSLWLGLFVVEEKHHGTGLAQRLYEQLEREQMRPFQTVFRLGVLPHNERARRFWERQGYVYEKDSITARGDHVHVLKKIIS